MLLRDRVLGAQLSHTSLFAPHVELRLDRSSSRVPFVRPTWTGARSDYLRDHNSPLIVAAFGAEAVLLCVPVASVSPHQLQSTDKDFSRHGRYAAHDSPLVQPVSAVRCSAADMHGRPLLDRPVDQMNVLFGNTISAVLGVCVAKLFELQPGFKIGGVYEPNWECVLVLFFALLDSLEPHGWAD